jgi:hypothetical protein
MKNWVYSSFRRQIKLISHFANTLQNLEGGKELEGELVTCPTSHG